MKKILLSFAVALCSLAAYSQVDTLALISQNNSKDFVTLDGKQLFTDFGARVKTSMVNYAIIVDERNQPAMLISLPYNGSHSPVPGTYNIQSGKKLAVKKGSQIAKIDIRPGTISTDDGGTMMVLYYNELHWFIGENINVVDKDGQTHKLSFKIGMFIEKT